MGPQNLYFYLVSELCWYFWSRGPQCENYHSKVMYASKMKFHLGISYDDLINDLLLINSNALSLIPLDPVKKMNRGTFLYLLEASHFYQGTGMSPIHTHEY